MCHQVSPLLKAINHVRHQVKNSTTLAIHSSRVRRMQECLKETTNFAQSQWLIRDLLVQRGGVRSDPRKMGTTPSLNKRFSPTMRLAFMVILT